MPQVSIADRMAAVIDQWRQRALKVPSHGQMDLDGHAVSWWFNPSNASTAEFMAALARDPDYIVPGKPDESVFLIDMLGPTRPMGQTLEDVVPTIREWIGAGCPVPAPAQPAVHASSALPPAATVPQAVPPAGAAPPADSTTSPQPPPPLPKPDEEREAFYKLLNIERYPDIRETARKFAYVYLANADFNKEAKFAPFEYSQEALDQRMDEIYNGFVADIDTAHGLDQPFIKFQKKKYAVGRASHKVVVDDLVQRAPFNLLDGVWLQNIMSARPSDAVMSQLFDIWADEAGNGEVEQNHANVYDNLLKSLGIYLPEVNSRAFIEYPFVETAWSSSVLQLCIGLFPQEFFPELLGMTLYLEWEATPSLTPKVRMLRGRGINPLFYALHVAIDNATAGHGALAKQAVKTFLEEQLQEGGADEMQRMWQRIWRGYVTWATVGKLGDEGAKRRLILDKKQVNVGTPEKPVCVPDLKAYYREQMLKVVRSKAEKAGSAHGSAQIGGQPLNGLFATPEKLLELLVSEHYVDPAHPRDSRLMGLMKFGRPMYRVFSEAEQVIVLDWIESLNGQIYPCLEPMAELPAPADPVQAMIAVIERHAAEAKMAHGGITLTTADGQAKPLRDLFDTPLVLMGALVASGWVSRGTPSKSFFLTRILRNGGPMEDKFSLAECAVVEEWIKQGASTERADAAVMATMMAAHHERTTQTRENELFLEARRSLGMGAVH